MMNHPDLSPEGRRRKREMLPDLQQAMRRSRERRRHRQSIATAAALLAVVGGLVLLLPGPSARDAAGPPRTLAISAPAQPMGIARPASTGGVSVTPMTGDALLDTLAQHRVAAAIVCGQQCELRILDAENAPEGLLSFMPGRS